MTRDPFVHLSSFGGPDLGCVCALAMLDEVCRPEFLEHVNEMGERFERGFCELKEKYPDLVAGWRRRGLMMAFELKEDRLGPIMTYALGKSGVPILAVPLLPREVSGRDMLVALGVRLFGSGNPANPNKPEMDCQLGARGLFCA